MHIPDNYLSPSTCGIMAVAMVPVWVHSVKKVVKDIPKEKMPLLGVGAAFSFLAMMFNIPLVGGTTGHAVCGTLIACLLGPEAACVSVSIALLIQALLFGDGGILAFGANCFNMAFILPFVGYGIFCLVKKVVKGKKGEYLGAAIGSYLGINAAAFAAAIEFGVQPYLFKDSLGQALYCPYDLSVSIPAMMVGHLLVAGVAEVIFTVLIYAFIRKVSPSDILTLNKTEKTEKRKGLYALIAVLVIATPLGLLATGAAWGEWGMEEMKDLVSNGKVLGYTPSGMENGFSFNSLCPDYAIGSLPEWFGYILSAVIGVAISIIIFKLIGSLMKEKVKYAEK